MLLGQTEAALNTVFWAGTTGFFALSALTGAVQWVKRALLLIPIVMIALFMLLGDIERAVQAGTDDFLSKPVNKAELLKRVDNMLKLHHVTDEVERLRQYIERMESR